MRYIYLLCIFFFAVSMHAQVGIGTNNPNSSSALHIESITKGVLFPRMNTVQRNAIPPVNGLIVYDTDSSSLYIYQPLPIGWKQLKSIASLKDLIAGVTAGDVLVWSGTEWVIKPINELFTFYYRDKDGDGLGDQYLTVNAVSQPPGYVNNNDDCNDDNAGTTQLSFYRDADGDGYGNPALVANSCTAPSGYVGNPNDCNDNNAAVNPGATETGNGVDDDCDGLIDEILSPDLPDDAFADTNEDGIDGTESAAIFVSASGIDANPGTKAQPKRTIQAGLAAAVVAGKTQVYIGNGTYNERVTLVNGISLYGGYSSANWSRATTNEATISGTFANGRISGIEGNSVTAVTTVDRLKVLTANATMSAVSNYGLYCNNCTGLLLKNSNIEAGAGGIGVTGSFGSDGAAGSNGSGGFNGSCDGAEGAGGAGGNSLCGRAGGAGGRGGLTGSNNGSAGANGAGGTLGGAGGSGCNAGCFTGCSGSSGFNGVTGAAGANGGNGGAGSGGSIVGGFWAGNGGAAGASGTFGNGGGGGGGGGGQGGCAVDDGGGNGGGGGGGGGCPGGGSSGGSAGGGSFGVFLVSSTGIQMMNNTIRSGTGGAGGAAGSVAGAGGNGGNGGVGASTCTGEVGRGGNGGSGGKGGNGGYGGGGAGGASYGIYRSNTTITLPGSNSISFGGGGTGGTSLGNNGATGPSGQVF